MNPKKNFLYSIFYKEWIFDFFLTHSIDHAVIVLDKLILHVFGYISPIYHHVVVPVWSRLLMEETDLIWIWKI